MYRYMKKQYLDSFMNQGSIRVGTLHDFRSDEHGKGIADFGEGRKRVSHLIEQRTITAKDMVDPQNIDAKAVRAYGGFQVTGGGQIHFQNSSFAMQFNHPDCYILCSSFVLSKETMLEFEGADSCIEIIDIDRFYLCLGESLLKKNGGPLIWRGHHKVLYRDREEQWNGENWGESPAVIKSKDFTKQAETRGIWVAANRQPIKPEIVVDARLPQFCRVIQL